jgi:hypothetical protein
MKDSFGWHKVKVYNDMSIMRKILELRVKEQKKKMDTIYLVCAPEGMGKSILTLWGLDILGEIRGEVVPVENVTPNVQSLMNRIAELKGNACLTMDEGSELGGDRSMEKKAKQIKEYFTIMRKAAFIIFICFTNPLKAGTYFREDRVRGVWFIKRKGEAWYYANSIENPHFTNILDKWGKDFDVKSIKYFTRYAPDFIMRFPDYNGYLREPYEKRKDQNITNVFDKNADYSEALSYAVSDIRTLKPEPGKHIKPKDIGKMINALRPGEVSRFIKKYELKKVNVGIHYYYLREDVENVLNGIVKN